MGAQFKFVFVDAFKIINIVEFQTFALKVIFVNITYQYEIICGLLGFYTEVYTVFFILINTVKRRSEILNHA